jgi:hypothetical protein
VRNSGSWQLAETNKSAGIPRNKTSWTALLKIHDAAKVIGWRAARIICWGVPTPGFENFQGWTGVIICGAEPRSDINKGQGEDAHAVLQCVRIDRAEPHAASRSAGTILAACLSRARLSLLRSRVVSNGIKECGAVAGSKAVKALAVSKKLRKEEYARTLWQGLRYSTLRTLECRTLRLSLCLFCSHPASAAPSIAHRPSSARTATPPRRPMRTGF